jgi:ribonuclease HII
LIPREQLSVFEEKARQRGGQVIAGVDEAGRGPLAGPVVAAACILPEGTVIEGIDDSKKLLPLKRYQLYEKILNLPGVVFGVGVVDSIRIDQVNILKATFEAMIIAIASLSKKPDYLLVDGSQLPPLDISAEAIIGGDGLCQSIAAASILAKVRRDRMMLEFHEKWPQYGFHKHKGYGTKEHLAALSIYGPSPIHRRSFKKENL